MRRWKSSLLANSSISMGALIVIFSLITLMFISGCDDDDTVVGPNNPPPEPASPYPSDEAVAQDVGVRLQWLCVDPDDDVLTYYITIGTTNPPTDVVDTVNTYLYNHDRLEFNTTYYWQVEADDGHGQTTESPVWSFTTGQLLFIDEYDAVRATRLFISDDTLIYVADDNWGLHIYEMTDTSMVGARIDSVGALGFTSLNTDVTTSGDTAFVATGEGLTLVNIIDPTVPELFEDPGNDEIKSEFKYDVNELYESEAVGLTGGYAIIAGPTAAWDNGDTTAYSGDTISVISSIDYSVPYAMVIVDSIKVAGSIFTDLYIEGNYAYVTDSLQGMHVINVSDPTNISYVTTVATNGGAMGVHVCDGIAYVADGLAGLTLFSLTNPASPTLLNNIDIPGIATDICVYDDPVSSKTHAFIAANWSGGMQIVDVTDPNNLEIVASRETTGGASGITAKRGLLDTDDDGEPNNIILVYLTDTYLGLNVFEFEP